MYDASTDARFACVRLRGPEEVVAFERCVLKAKKPVPTVKRLFISTQPGYIPNEKRSPGRLTCKQLTRRRYPEGMVHEPAIDAAIRIVTALAPRLVHLAFHASGGREALNSLLPTSLPALQELEWMGPFGPSETAAALPRLHCVHFVGSMDEAKMRVVMRLGITHVRVSGLHWNIPSVLDAALSALQEAAPSSSPAVLHFPGSLELIPLQPEVPDLGNRWCTAGNVAYMVMMCDLEADASNDWRVVLLHALPESSRNAALNTIEAQFVDRCSGGLGAGTLTLRW